MKLTSFGHSATATVSDDAGVVLGTVTRRRPTKDAPYRYWAYDAKNSRLASDLETIEEAVAAVERVRQ